MRKDGTVPGMGDEGRTVLVRESADGVLRRAVIHCCLAVAAVLVVSMTLGAVRSALALLG